MGAAAMSLNPHATSFSPGGLPRTKGRGDEEKETGSGSGSTASRSASQSKSSRSKQKSGGLARAFSEKRKSKSKKDISGTSARQTSSSRSNANHLLNFKYGSAASSSGSGSQSKNKHHHRSKQHQQRNRRKHVAYSKELFVQANYRFLVADNIQVEDYLANPDKMLDWEDVAQVCSISEVEVQCPICLEEPLAAQTTTCGHIFCIACLMKYACLSGCKRDLQCPLCFGPISLLDLRDCSFVRVQRPKVGESLRFNRLLRRKTSIFPMGVGVPRAKFGRCYPYGKFTLCADYKPSMQKMVLFLENYAKELVVQGNTEECEELLPFIFLAADVLQQRHAIWKERKSLKSLPLEDGDNQGSALPGLDNMLAVAQVKASEAVKVAEQAQKDKELWPSLLSNDAEGDAHSIEGKNSKGRASIEGEESWEREHSESKVGDDTKDQEDAFYSYYQSSDGQNIFLHPINVKCLIEHYGKLEEAPVDLTAPVVEIESFPQTEDTRKRFRFLSHLPISSTVTMCELDLSDEIPKSAFKPFQEELKKRRRKRERLQKRKEEEEAKKLLVEKEEAASSASFLEMRISSSQDENENDALGREADLGSSPSGISFSNVTKLGFASGIDSPHLENEASNSASNAAWGGGSSPSQNVWASLRSPQASPKTNGNIVWEKKKKHGKNVRVMKWG